MSIQLLNVTKSYGEQAAMDDVSFTASPGKITALLGPNGAGKSTTMKVVSAFLPFDSGEVKVCGLDVSAHAELVKQKIGYLPEHNPLYTELYIKEYLSIVADIHKIKDKKKRIEEIIEITGLGLEQNKKISALSKGYKQRVGIAQAIIHNPEVLILDEPTSGLDPNQLVEIRTLIKKLSKDKTVILSTHIMQEVEALCDHVILIDRGKIVANDSTKELLSNTLNQSVVVIELMNSGLESGLSGIKGVNQVKAMSDKRFKVYTDKDYDVRPALFDFVVASNNKILTLNREEKNIEHVFQQLTSD